MATAATVREFKTIAELLDDLGVGPERVRLKPAPGTATEQDVIDVWNRERKLCELVAGTLVEKTGGTPKGTWLLGLSAFCGSISDATTSAMSSAPTA